MSSTVIRLVTNVLQVYGWGSFHVFVVQELTNLLTRDLVTLNNRYHTVHVRWLPDGPDPYETPKAWNLSLLSTTWIWNFINKLFLACSSKHVGIFSFCHDSISCYGSCQSKMGVNLLFNLDNGPILLCCWILHWRSRKKNERCLWVHWIFRNVLLQYLHWIPTCIQLKNAQSCPAIQLQNQLLYNFTLLYKRSLRTIVRKHPFHISVKFSPPDTNNSRIDSFLV